MIQIPLTVVSANAARLLAEFRTEEADPGRDEAAQRRLHSRIDTVSDLVSAATRISNIINDLRTFSQAQPIEGTATDVRAAVERALRATVVDLAHCTVELVQLVDGAVTPMSATRLEQVLVNLLVNAAHASTSSRPEENRVTVRVEREGGKILLAVSDSGTGIPVAVLPHIFEPFFTTKESGRGTGLGLAICHGIVNAAGGQIDVESQIGIGTTFRVRIPEQMLRADVPQGTARAADPSRSPTGKILVIDDETMILKVLRHMLRENEVVCMSDARDALELLRHDSTFDIIFTDLTMPTMNGMDFYNALTTEAPEMARRVVFLTGGATTPEARAFLNRVENPVLQKPISINSLLEFIRDRLAIRIA